MSSTAAPASADSAPERNLNHSDIRDVADSLPDDFAEYDDSPSSDHERHDREEPELSGEARRAAEDLNLDEGEEPAERPKKRQKQPQDGREAEEAPEGGEEAEGASEDDEGEEQPEDGSEPEAKEPDKDAKPDRLNLRDDAVIVIDGHEINGAEVKRGFLRQADYTRKTQEVAAERQQVQALRQHIGAQEQELAQILDLATAITRDVIPEQPDIRQYDTSTSEGVAAFLRAQQAYQGKVQGLQKLVEAQRAQAGQMTEQQRADLQAQEEQRQQQMQAHLQNEIRLLQERIPELRTREGWNNLYSDVEKFGGHYNLTPADVNALQDHRQYAVLRDALAYRKLQAAKPAVQKQVQAAPPIRPAARQGSGTRAADPNRSAQEAFKRNPTARTAAATLPDSWFE